MGPIPDVTADDVVGDGVDRESSEWTRSSLNEIDLTWYGHRPSSSRRNGADPPD
jgi:hypothetical protein